MARILESLESKQLIVGKPLTLAEFKAAYCADLAVPLEQFGALICG